MKNAEIKELSTPDILERIEGEKSLLLKQRLNHAVSPLDNPHKMTDTKKNIARLNTELRSRQLTDAKKQ
jgi:large subunit ribosomal protein L29